MAGQHSSEELCDGDKSVVHYAAGDMQEQLIVSQISVVIVLLIAFCITSDAV